jgi:hypothetical protein
MSAEESGAAAGPPLGELLLSRGLITAEQLEEALADQRDSGRPLGEIFVRLGFATGPMIGQALATQQGRMLKSEYGFATGFDATSAATDEDQREPPPVTVRSAERPKLVPTDGVPLAQAGGLRLASTPQPAAVQAPAVAATATVEPDEAPAVQPDPLDRERADAKAALEVSQRAQDAPAVDLRESVARLEADIDEVTRERDDAGAQLRAATEALAARDAAPASTDPPHEEDDRIAAQVAHLEQGLADARAAIAALQRDAALASSVRPPEATAESSHLVFFPASSGGWVVLERTGPAPAVGAVVDMSADGGSAFGSVTKIGPPPVPGTKLRCAYLV